MVKQRIISSIKIWGLKLGIEGIGRLSSLLLIPICLIISIAILILTPKMSFDNFLHVLENGFSRHYFPAYAVLMLSLKE